jgi:signal peptidase I
MAYILYSMNRAVKRDTKVYIVIIGVSILMGWFLSTYVFGVYVVISGSMIPTLEVGEIIVIVPVHTPSVGDIVVYTQPIAGHCTGLTIVHRIVAISPQGVITQGDNRLTNPSPDAWSPTPFDCIKGKVILGIPYLGYISFYLRPPYNYVIVAAVVLTGIALEVSKPRRSLSR